jgi:hypothetical protein
MIDEDLSGLPRSALRDYSEDPRLDRVWNRLESELGQRPARSRSGWVLAPAFGVSLFFAGVFVGRNVIPPDPAPPELLAERVPPVEARANVGQPASSPREQAARPLPSARPRTPAPRSGPGPAQPIPMAVEVTSAREMPVHPPLPPSGPPEWLRLAELGDLEAARVALDREGGFDIAVLHASPEQLLVLVDVARASGSRERALRALRRLLDHFRGAPEAPLAAWTLGNMLEQAGDGAGAAEAFALYRRLSPAGDFAEDAAARQVHVALSQGNVELAVQLLDQYAKDFPNGRRLSEFREELGKLQAEQADAGVVEPQPLAPVPGELPALGH